MAMDEEIKKAFEKSKSGTKDEQYEAYLDILEITNQEVDWAYEVWDQLLEDLSHTNNHQRSRAAQYLANLAAKSDPENRMVTDFPQLWEVTKDKRFVTARHSLQAIWKVGLAGKAQRDLVMDAMVDRFENGTEEKNYTLIRSDILENMKQLYEHLEDESIKNEAMRLIELVDDPKYKKKYQKIWN